MKKFITILLLLFSSLYAKGVSAGTVIENSATLTFSMQEDDFSIQSNVVKDIVNQLIDVDVSWMDTDPVTVGRGDKERVLTFKVINSGNGQDLFLLESDEAGGHSDFKTNCKKIYLDTNDNLMLDKNDKIVSSVSLKADETALLFVSSNIEEKISANKGAKSYVRLKATSKRGGSGVRGTLHKKGGIDGIDAIDGIRGGVASEDGIYQLLDVNVYIQKSIWQANKRVDTFNINSLLQIEIDVAISGEGVVHDLSIRDMLPKEVSYVQNTMTVDGKTLTDARDRDGGKYLVLERGVVVFFKKLQAPSKHTITYKVKVKKD